VQRLVLNLIQDACSSPDRTGFSLHSNKLLHSVATEIKEKEARNKKQEVRHKKQEIRGKKQENQINQRNTLTL